MLRSLTPEEFEQEAGESFRRVFASTDPFHAPFTEAMSERAILFKGTFRLDAPEASALDEAATRVGNRGFYLTLSLIHI